MLAIQYVMLAICRIMLAISRVMHASHRVQRHSPLSSTCNQTRQETFMARVRLNLRNLSVTDKIAKGRQIVTAMTNNATFPTPNPPLAEVTGTIEDLEKANAA